MSQSERTRRYYTVEEANQTLPYVKRVVADIVAQVAGIQERKERLERVARSRGKRASDEFYDEELAQVEADIVRELETLKVFISELDLIGVEIKDLSRGLIDFYSMMDGREVYLCWMHGEEEIAHWHELDAGFSGRQSLLTCSGCSTESGSSRTGESDSTISANLHD